MEIQNLEPSQNSDNDAINSDFFIIFYSFQLSQRLQTAFLHSKKIEDKAVDLHLLKQALESKHHLVHEKAFQSIMEGYKGYKHYKEVLKQLQKVESRGRYKGK